METKCNQNNFAKFIELENFRNRVFIFVLLYETNSFFQFNRRIKKAPTVLNYYKSNVKAQAIKLPIVPVANKPPSEKSINICDVGWEKVALK